MAPWEVRVISAALATTFSALGPRYAEHLDQLCERVRLFRATGEFGWWSLTEGVRGSRPRNPQIPRQMKGTVQITKFVSRLRRLEQPPRNNRADTTNCDSITGQLARLHVEELTSRSGSRLQLPRIVASRVAVNLRHFIAGRNDISRTERITTKVESTADLEEEVTTYVLALDEARAAASI